MYLLRQYELSSFLGQESIRRRWKLSRGNAKFGEGIGKNLLSEVLQLLQANGAKFQLEERGLKSNFVTV